MQEGREMNAQEGLEGHKELRGRAGWGGMGCWAVEERRPLFSQHSHHSTWSPRSHPATPCSFPASPQPTRLLVSAYLQVWRVVEQVEGAGTHGRAQRGQHAPGQALPPRVAADLTVAPPGACVCGGGGGGLVQSLFRHLTNPSNPAAASLAGPWQELSMLCLL